MPSPSRVAAIAAAALVTVAAAFGAWRASAGPKVGTYPVERADLLQTVVASGRVESPRRVEIGSPVTGTVASIPVVEGQSVAAGQLLVALDTSESRALSGGQQQRVAIARALAMRPPLVLADQPTGNLDTKSADGVFDVMRAVNAESGTTFLVVTHDPRLAARCDRVIELVDGRVVADGDAAYRESRKSTAPRVFAA